MYICTSTYTRFMLSINPCQTVKASFYIFIGIQSFTVDGQERNSRLLTTWNFSLHIHVFVLYIRTLDILPFFFSFFSWNLSLHICIVMYILPYLFIYLIFFGYRSPADHFSHKRRLMPFVLYFNCTHSFFILFYFIYLSKHFSLADTDSVSVNSQVGKCVGLLSESDSVRPEFSVESSPSLSKMKPSLFQDRLQ